MKKTTVIKIEQDLIDIANEGQTDKKVFKGEAFTRSFAGRVKDVAKLRNPLVLAGLVYEIERTLQIINPELKPEIDWLNKLQPAIKLFHNEILHANRLLGIKNDNHYDTRVFEEAIRQHFFLLDKDMPKQDAVIQTDFKTLIELVELGARRFGH